MPRRRRRTRSHLDPCARMPRARAVHWPENGARLNLGPLWCVMDGMRITANRLSPGHLIATLSRHESAVMCEVKPVYADERDGIERTCRRLIANAMNRRHASSCAILANLRHGGHLIEVIEAEENGFAKIES